MNTVLALNEAGDLRIAVIAATRRAAVVEPHLFAVLNGGEVAAGRAFPRFVSREHDFSAHRLMQLQSETFLLRDEGLIDEKLPA